jgi:hypothetical protein
VVNLINLYANRPGVKYRLLENASQSAAHTTFEIIFVGGIFLGEQIGGADLLMMGVVVMFGEVIGFVGMPFCQ